MTEFANYLKEYLENHNLSQKKAAQMCQIDRTLLGRYSNGYRMPKNMKIVLNIAKGLQMTEQESENLCLLYNKSKDNQQNPKAKELFEQLLYNSKVELPDERELQSKKIQLHKKTEYARNLSQKEEILHYIHYITNHSNQIWIQMNPTNLEVTSILLSILRYSNCSTNQVIEMSARMSENNSENINKIQALLPFLFYSKNYKVYSYYKKVPNTQENEMQLNFMASDKGMVLFNGQMSVGIFSNQENYLSYYHNMYQSICQKCSLLAQTISVAEFTSRYHTYDYYLENKNSNTILACSTQEKAVWIEKKDLGEQVVYIKEIGIFQMFLRFIRNETKQGNIL